MRRRGYCCAGCEPMGKRVSSAGRKRAVEADIESVSGLDIMRGGGTRGGGWRAPAARDVGHDLGVRMGEVCVMDEDVAHATRCVASPGEIGTFQPHWLNLVDEKTGLSVAQIVDDPNKCFEVENVDMLSKVFVYFDEKIHDQGTHQGDVTAFKTLILPVHERLAKLSEYHELTTLVIKDRFTGGLRRFKLNYIQRRLYALIVRLESLGFPVRILILKARQWGGSTLVEALIYLRTKNAAGTNGLVVAHKQKASRHLFGMYKRYYTFDPLKRMAEVGVKNLEYVDDFGGEITIATGYSEDSGRSETIHHLHLSEAAWYRTAESFVALMETVPDALGSTIFIETTPNGQDEFYDMWCNANYAKFFAPWFMYEGYSKQFTAPKEKEDFIKTLTESEQEIRSKFSLNLNQLYWRRDKIFSPQYRGNVEKFNQEYPQDDKSCFMSSGRGYFGFAMEEHWERVNVMCNPMDKKYRLFKVNGEKYTASEAKEFILPDDFGGLTVWHYPQPGTRYYIGADISQGEDASLDERVRKQDFSVAQVISESLQGGQYVHEQVATYVTQEPTDVLWKNLIALCRWYNNAWIAPERNGIGVQVVRDIRKKYEHVFRMPKDYWEEMTLEAAMNREEMSIMYGWYTTGQTRPIMLNELNNRLRMAQSLIINDKFFMDETTTFIVDRKGKPRAKSGYFDDKIISMAIALQCAMWSPKTNNTSSLQDDLGDDQHILDKLTKLKVGENFGGYSVLGAQERDSFGFVVKKF